MINHSLLLPVICFVSLPSNPFAADPSSQMSCKSVPQSTSWPDATTRDLLNKSIGGHLLAPLPPAIVCDPSRKSTYDARACKAVGKGWGDPLFHAEDPVSVQSPNFQADGCLPTSIYNKTTACFTKPFAHYVVKATSADHVAAAVKFTKKHHVRLSVKSTGHDYLGRSAQPGFSIWTRHIRGIQVLKSFKPASCEGCRATTAIKVSAGEIFGDVYKEAKAHSVIPVVGGQNTVGLGGYLLGGGHSPISTKYGLAVDNALEMDVVTPDGDIVTVNDHKGSDLFWALKGGGGSTFGVVISATLKTYPTFSVTPFLIQFASTKTEAKNNNNDHFYNLLADFHTMIPSLSDANLTGVSFIAPKNAKTSKPITDPNALIHGPQIFVMSGTALKRSEQATRELLLPLKEKLKATSGVEGQVTISSQTDIYRTFESSGAGSDQITVGINQVTGGWLWGKQALSNKTRLISTFRAVQPTFLSGGMISGPGVINAPRPNDVSVTPAWRRTYLRIITGVTWPFRNETARRLAIKQNRDVQLKYLSDIAPDMGAYLNEASPYQKNLPQAFWGSNYARLLELKRKYDPDGVFFCGACVGAEDWKVKENGEVCRKQK